tara:strand:+ start:99 stop:284 length:186 start_codon:yes stop_codon:yes gene_type:complete
MSKEKSTIKTIDVNNQMVRIQEGQWARHFRHMKPIEKARALSVNTDKKFKGGTVKKTKEEN